MSPEQILPIVLIALMIVVAIVLIMVGIQLFLLLKETRNAVTSVDNLVKNTDDKLNMLVNPIRTLASLASGVAGGMKAFESFSVWLKNKKLDK
ncbi:MAG: hypothetical protein Q4G02_00560 [bacterium]|nr:hypothetical protein [bacterium]